MGGLEPARVAGGWVRFVAKQAQPRCWCHTPAYENKGPGSLVNGDEVRDIRFLGRGVGYDASQVDDLLRRIAVELDTGRPAGPLIAGAAFRWAGTTLRREETWSREYDVEAVDWFLDHLRRREDCSDLAAAGADPWRDLPVANYFAGQGPGGLAERTAAPSRQSRLEQADQDLKDLAQECAGAWRDFSQQPGTHLRLARAGVVRRELRTAEQQTVASLRDYLPTAVSTGGRTFTWRQVPGSSRPDIVEIVRRSHGDYPRGHFLPAEAPLQPADTPGGRKRPAKASSQEPGPDARRDLNLGELLDATGMPVLYASGSNYSHSAGACITFPDQRWLRFPVRGTEHANAIMTAVDQDGNKVARYRVIGRLRTVLQTRMEITVHPAQPLTDDLALALAISAPWLSSYFTVPNQGGGV